MEMPRILVVEDEAIVNTDIADRLTALGYQVAGRAARAEQAMELAQAQHPDLVLMDLHPKDNGDGIDAAREIRRRLHLPVIFLSAYFEDETLERAKLAQPYGFLLKPFEDRELKFAIDIALHKHQAEEEIYRLNRLFSVLSQVNHAVVHSRSQEKLLAAVCRILVECGKVDLAWIGWLDPDTSRIKPVVHFGRHAEILEHLEYYADDRPAGQGPPGRALREGQPFICHTCPGASCLYTADKQPHHFGFHSCGSFPLRFQGQVCAVLNICVSETHFFGDRETELVQQVALDLSFSLDKLESEAQRELAEEALRQNEEFLTDVFNSIQDGLSIVDRDLNILRFNPRLAALPGLRPELGKKCYEAYHGRTKPCDICAVQTALRTGKKGEKIFELAGPDGSTLYIESHAYPLLNHQTGRVEGAIEYVREISERKRLEKALQESERRVRAKLESILAPEGDIGQLELEDIVDVKALQALMDDFHLLTRLSMAIIDLRGKVLVYVGWQDICTKFHRLHPASRQRCYESDLQLSQGIDPGTFRLYKCKNNLWSIATPIVVGGKLLGNLFMGQFFFEDESIDYDLFRSQAQQFGFAETDYLAALGRVPRWNRQTIVTAMNFFSKLAHMVSMLCHSNIKLARSITEQERLLEFLTASEEKIRADEQFLEDIFSSIKDGLSILDLDRNVIRVNPAMENLPHYPPLLGRKCYEVYHNRHTPCQICPVEHTLQTGEANLAVIQRKFGEGTEFYEIYSYPLINHTGQLTGIIEFIRDVTEQKKAGEALQEMERQLQQAQKMEALGTLAGGIAHDFNNILWAIMGYAEMATYNLLNPDMARQHLDQVVKASQRAKNLVSQILAFSRRLESEKKPLYPNAIAREAINLLRASLPATIEIRHQLCSDSPILADPTQMSQVIINLATNALHAMEKTGGRLTVTLEDAQIDSQIPVVQGDLQPGFYARIKIEDTGTGIPPEILPRIFEPYFTTKDVGKGTGLGLATVLGIVKSHGGEIALASQPGQGTVVTLYFPIIDQQPDQPLPEPPTLPKSNGRILFIDDEPSLAELGKAALTRLGYEVTSFTNSQEAWSTIEARPREFDLVITDLTMPRLTGLDLAQRLHALLPDLPIIICTGYSELLKLEEVGQWGVKEILTKPLGLTQLAETVKKTLQPNSA